MEVGWGIVNKMFISINVKSGKKVLTLQSPMNNEAQETEVWYPLRVTYHRELRVKDDLDARGIRNFVPMQYRREERGGRMVKRLVPSVHNLIFVRLTPTAMREYKMTTAMPVRYMMDRETRRPIIVSDREMDNFIAVAGTYEEQLVYLDPDLTSLAKGDRVRIIGGIFAGAEGMFLRVKGDRRVVVAIPGVVAVATTFVHPSMIEKI